jgi:superfamily II DNA/RNA helicase
MTLDPARDLFADAQSFPSLFDRPGEINDPADRPIVDTIDAQYAEPAIAATGSVQIENIEVEHINATESPTSFADLGLPHRVVDTLARDGITTPFPIQTATIPDALAGRDVLGRGQTGSGKTLAFGLPLMVRIANSGKAIPQHPKALILVPTRELAMQVNDALVPVARSLGLFSRTAVGGMAYDKQIRDLRRGVDIMVATPGRLGDLIERGECSLDLIEITVLDEADQMADMGFLPDVTALLAKTPERSQRLLFSATLDSDVDALVKQFLDNAATHEVDPPSPNVSTMEHHLLLISPVEKFDIIASIGARKGRTIMFVRTQMAVDRLHEQLAAVGVRAGALHGGKTQRVRTRTLAEFREGRVDVLVATDVAARGIHVDDVSLVVHIDPPKDSKEYLHRAGRTARAGESGMVVTLVMPRQRRSTYSMLERAGVTPGKTEVRLGSPGLTEVTGASTPSGVPFRVEEPEQRGRFDRPRRPYREDRPRSFQDRPAHGDRPYRSYQDRPQSGRSYSDRPQGSNSDRPQGERTYADRPRVERTHSERPRTFGSDRAHADRAARPRDDRFSRPREDRPHTHRPRLERSL